MIFKDKINSAETKKDKNHDRIYKDKTNSAGIINDITMIRPASSESKADIQGSSSTKGSHPIKNLLSDSLITRRGRPR